MAAAKPKKISYLPMPVIPGKDYFIYEGTHAPLSDYNAHSHEWGQFICLDQGVLSTNVGQQRLFCLPEFGAWVPANLEHSTYNFKTTAYICVNFQPTLLRLLPDQPCQIKISSIFTAILKDLLQRRAFVPESAYDHRLYQVLLDQLILAEPLHSYLPSSDDEMLLPLLHALETQPDDNTPLSEWAARLYTSERTLSRRFNEKLGISFLDWRRRLRFTHAIAMLDQGMQVGEVAYAVGYHAVSAFIIMFQQMAGISPERYRQHLQGKKK